MRKDYMMTLVRARPPSDSLLAPWCDVMLQGDVITVGCRLPRANHWSNLLMLPWLTTVSNDGAGNCMFEALGHAFAKPGSDRRSHSQDGCCGKDDGL